MCCLTVVAVEKTKDGASISLKLQDGRGSIVRVYVGMLPWLAANLPWARCASHRAHMHAYVRMHAKHACNRAVR